MHDIDYSGPMGGALAVAFGAGATAGATFMTAIGALISRLFITPRIKALEADRAELRNRVNQLETVLLAYGPTAVRQQLQSAIAAAATPSAPATDLPLRT